MLDEDGVTVTVGVVLAVETVTEAGPDELATQWVSPPYFKLKLCVPSASGCVGVFTLKLRLDSAFPAKLVAAITALPSSRETVPVGTGPSAPTARLPVIVIGVPGFTVAGP
jgi:hypothetical protein